MPLPPKLSLKRTGWPVAAWYSRTKHAVMRSYALRVVEKDTSVSVTCGGGFAFFFSSFRPAACTDGCVEHEYVYSGLPERAKPQRHQQRRLHSNQFMLVPYCLKTKGRVYETSLHYKGIACLANT